MSQNAKQLERLELYAHDGRIGRVHDCFFDDREWVVRYLIVDTGTWLNSRKVMISPIAARHVEIEAGRITVALSQAQVRNSPSIDMEQSVSREDEAALLQYYHWPSYGAGFPELGFGMRTVSFVPLAVSPISRREAGRGYSASPFAAALESRPRETSHLRSLRAVKNHAIEATDGQIGRVEDFLVDLETWKIGFVVVDPRNEWPGQRVMVSPRWISEEGWDESKVRDNLPREAIHAGPPSESDRAVRSEDVAHLSDDYDEARHQGR